MTAYGPGAGPLQKANRAPGGATLLLAAVLATPTLLNAVDGSVSWDVALVRYLVVAAACWALQLFVQDWLRSMRRSAATAAAESARAEQQAADDSSTGPAD